GWQGPLDTFNPGGGACVNHTDVALAGTTAHVIATIQNPCENTSSSALHYRTCDLTTGQCGDEQVVYEETAVGMRLLEAYVTLDQDEQPHIVFGRRDVLSAVDEWERRSEIWYARRGSDGITWKRLRLSNSQNSAYRPSITWSWSPTDEQGYVHFVWETHEPPPASGISAVNGRVRYRRCPDDVEQLSGAIDCNNNPDYSGTLLADTHPHPTLVAEGDRVILFWNRCSSFEPNPPCERFSLLYQRSELGGWGFNNIQGNPRSVRSNLETTSTRIEKYHGTDAGTVEYESGLRAAATLNDSGLPVVAWQVKNPEVEHGYTITTTWVVSQTQNTLGWMEPGWSEGTGHDTRVATSIAVPDPAEEAVGLHMVFMKRAGLYEGYQIYYSYFGTELYTTPTPEPTDPGEDPTPTPTVTPIVPSQFSNKAYLPLVMRGAR
ncbi:MAG: hypothetical protein ACP5GX_11655, partial [Anaerolineae bacterium]